MKLRRQDEEEEEEGAMDSTELEESPVSMRSCTVLIYLMQSFLFKKKLINKQIHVKGTAVVNWKETTSIFFSLNCLFGQRALINNMKLFNFN